MTDSTPDRRIHGAALEPWALDLLEAENGDSGPEVREELGRVVALLRDLEEPAPDPDRVERLVEALAREGSRPNGILIAIRAARRAFPPPLALALAAGMAGLLAITAVPEWLPTSSPERDSADVTRSTRVAADDSRPASRPVPVRRRSTPVIRPQMVNVSAFSPSSAMAPHRGYDRAPFESAYDHDLDLDRQLNQLMIDPDAFARRLERVGQRDRFIARLADRAAQRGDAPEIALRVRQSRHPLAAQLVDRLLRSTFIASVSPR